MDTQMVAQLTVLLFSVLGLLPTSHSLPKVYPCYARPADVFFILDSSNSIWRPDFETQLDFVNDVIDFFPIGDDSIHVGVITFGTFTNIHFNLDRFQDKDDIHRAVREIEQEGGIYTRTDRALEVMRNSFRKNAGSREGVIKVGIVITDGRSTNPEITRMQAMYARALGINLFAIGVGDSLDDVELRNLANEPSDDFMFLVDNYNSLDKIKEILAIRTCTVTDPPTTTTPTTTATTTTPAPTTTTPAPTTTPTRPVIRFETTPVLRTLPPKKEYLKGRDSILFGPDGCEPKQPLDIAFIIDDKQGGTENKRHLHQLISDVIQQLDYDNDDVRISFIRECASVPEMRLSRFHDKNSILDHLDKTRPVLERTPGLLRAATNRLNASSDGIQTNLVDSVGERQKIAVYITNGESRDLEGTLREAQYAKHDNDVNIIGVGVGQEVNLVELKALVSCDPEDHLHTAESHRDLHTLSHDIARNICQVSLL